MDNQIAIVGMSCRFAGVNSPASLWNVVMSGRSQLQPLGPQLELLFGQKRLFGDHRYPVRIGALGNLYSYVPSMQNVPRQLNAGENQDLYFATQLAFDALADAAMKPHSRDAYRGTVRVGYAPPFNSSTINWLLHTEFMEQTLDILSRFFNTAPAEALDPVKAHLQESLPQPNAASFLMGTGYRFASWIARECAFGGAATVMDSGMLTGAATIMSAIDDLTSNRADIALAGCLTPPMSRAMLEGLSGEIPFTERPELHPFSEEQTGTHIGEGGAFFVLKRRSDALKNRDRIYALVRSVSIGHTPRDDEAATIREAAKMAEVPIKSIGLIEADGTGVKEQERREILAIQRLWGEHHPGEPLVGIGSVKGNIGHTLRASMAAGMVKAALALHMRVLPPQIAPQVPSELLSNLTSSAYLLTEARPWISDDSTSPRRAMVLGANFDAVNPVDGTDVVGRSAAILLEEEREDRS